MEILIYVAPTIFLLGYLVMIATGVHMTLARLSPGAPATDASTSTSTGPQLYDVSVKASSGREVAFSVKQADDERLREWLRPVAAFRDSYFDILKLAEGAERPWLLLVVVLVCGVVTAVASGRININEFSLNHFYKNRLVRCYLGASKSRARQPNPFTGFDPRDDFPIGSLMPQTTVRGKPTEHTPYLGPYPIVNATLNLNTGSELAQQERKAASFVFTPAFCGFDPPSSRESRQERLDGEAGFHPDGYRPTRGYSYPVGPGIGTTVAISGAAASPNMGYHTSGPMAFLLTVFNVRLGWWLGNPRWDEPSRRPGPVFALRYLFAELLGQTTGVSKFVNLSDGGHFENLGCTTGEAALSFHHRVRRGGGRRSCVRFARRRHPQVPGGHRVEIDINPDPIRVAADGFSTAHCVVGRIAYPDRETAFTAGMTKGISPVAEAAMADNSGPARGWLLYLKASLTGDEPADVIEYRFRAPEFPHQSTGDQFFSESQFESYRRLGYHVLRSAFEGISLGGPGRNAVPADSLTARYPLVEVFQALTRTCTRPFRLVTRPRLDWPMHMSRSGAYWLSAKA